MMIVAERVVSDHGTIVLLAGTEVVADGDMPESWPARYVTFAVDHRMAQPIIDAMERGDQPECFVEDWLVLE